jgi:isopentenyl phosphate kinase
VLKVGGSILTDRRHYCTLDPDSLRRVAAALAAWLPAAPCSVVLILGGGSFGHNVVLEHEVRFDGRHGRPTELFELTARLFDLKIAVVRELAARGVTAMPLQETAVFLRRLDGSLALSGPVALTRCFESGWLPVLTGGLLPDEESRSFVPVSSDRLALPLADRFPVWRCVMLTDRPGLCDPEAMECPPMRRVRRDRHPEALNLLGASSKADVTGAMGGKLRALLELAAAGVESVIGDGRGLDATVLASYFGEDPPGTFIEACS